MNISKMKMNNKGAVEMSLNLIIMLVIGLTVMGLIIAFVTNFLNEATSGIGDTVSDAEEQRLRDVQGVSGNLVIQPSQVTLERGESKTIFMKMENPLSDAIDGIFAGGELQDSGDFSYEVTGINSDDADFTIELNPIRLDPSETDSFRLITTVGDSTPAGNYFLTFNWENTEFDKIYSQAITVVVE